MKKISSFSILVLFILMLLIGSASAPTVFEGHFFMGVNIAPVSEVHAMLSVGFSMIGITQLGRKKLAKQVFSVSK